MNKTEEGSGENERESEKQSSKDVIQELDKVKDLIDERGIHV